jgi:hypothetical protein
VTKPRKTASGRKGGATRRLPGVHQTAHPQTRRTAKGRTGAVQKAQALFSTDCYEVDKGVIPPAPHRASTKLSRTTNHVERCNCTVRQRVSRLVRAMLSFSKKLANPIGAMRCSLTWIALPSVRGPSGNRRSDRDGGSLSSVTLGEGTELWVLSALTPDGDLVQRRLRFRLVVEVGNGVSLLSGIDNDRTT